ncbi:hypothetical protein QUB80_21205 [Chlorogloeopsis sp. ULAP01]|uniref:hypothetical protein n=1 Tax=Chlorogloeopsis sp. ULAP01 TaxID=3056483 RepID=UPI0025AB3BC5|nr:hypothetical protein [Chlorogloeopsis sp. ULAP01]MDM9383213.1 hypothetical protein [Chlorogloeopsis sp. ULAP01]
MKHIVQILVFLLLLNACTTQVIEKNNQAAKTEVKNCPQSALVSLAIPGEQESFYERFNFHIRNIISDADTINFQTSNYDFVFCRGNNSWTVQTGTLPQDLKQQNYPVYSQQFQTIQFQNQNYQYRVVREPATPTIPNPNKDKVVFELITPNSKNPQRQTLYTLQELQQKTNTNIGTKIGLSRITAAVIWENRIWWPVAFEQGEGNDGIATIVSYEPQTNKIILIQPLELLSHQITDLAITGAANNPTFWLGTKKSGEGNLYIPGKGLVAYRHHSQNLNFGTLTSCNVNNSPLVGAIPDKLLLENNTLWVGTGNGICQIKLQAADHPENWSCWRFAAMAKLPQAGLPVYSELSNQTPTLTLSPTNNSETVEVLWWSPVDFQTRKGRYEVRTEKGFTVKLDQGATQEQFRRFLPPGKPPVYWPGFEWHWNGERFVRGFDEVAINEFGGGPLGIGVTFEPASGKRTANAIRGDLELLEISPQSTSVKYYSGWVDETQLNPYLTVLPHAQPQNPQPNPLEAIAKKIEDRG